MKKLQITLSDPLAVRLKMESEEKDISASEIIRRCLDSYFEEQDKKKGN